MKLWHQLAEYASFETERLLMRPFVYADGPAFFALTAADQALPFIFPPMQDLSQCQAFLVTQCLMRPLGVWAITDKQTERLLGAIYLEQIDLARGKAELVYFLQRAAWGQGLMTEVVHHLSQLLLLDADFTALDLVIHTENLASQRLAEKAGYCLQGQYRGSDRYTRKMRTYRRYRLTATMMKRRTES